MVDVISHEIFPTRIHEFEYKPDSYQFSNMVQYIKNKDQSTPLYQTEDDIHNMSFFQDFRSHIIKINKYILDELDYDYEDITITNMWGNILSADSSIHAPHTHSNNFLSGVYYLQTEGETAPIEFFDPRPQASISVPRRLKNNIYNSHKVQFDSTQNRGFIFPSWLQHWVSPNYNKRISISWNIQVNGHYGEPKTLQNAYIKKERS
tara:strand:+ start:419 stop:1036 length:618 start_codon:yes stop_codon:yes gene_type:complete